MQPPAQNRDSALISWRLPGSAWCWSPSLADSAEVAILAEADGADDTACQSDAPMVVNGHSRSLLGLISSGSWKPRPAGAVLGGDRTGWGHSRGGQALMRSRPAGWCGPGTADESFAGRQGCGSRVWGQAVSGACGLAGSWSQMGVDLAGDVSLEAADD